MTNIKSPFPQLTLPKNQNTADDVPDSCIMLNLDTGETETLTFETSLAAQGVDHYFATEQELVCFLMNNTDHEFAFETPALFTKEYTKKFHLLSEEEQKKGATKVLRVALGFIPKWKKAPLEIGWQSWSYIDDEQVAMLTRNGTKLYHEQTHIINHRLADGTETMEIKAVKVKVIPDDRLDSSIYTIVEGHVTFNLISPASVFAGAPGQPFVFLPVVELHIFANPSKVIDYIV